MRWIVNLTIVPLMVFSSYAMAEYAADLPGIPPETVTDYIHAVIESHRTFLYRSCGRPHAEAGWRSSSRELPS